MRLRYGLAAALPLAVMSLLSEPNEGTGSLSNADHVPGQVRDSLRLELIVADRVSVGQSVRFTLRVENVSTRTFDLYLRGRESTFDVELSRESGDLVWQRLDGAIVPAIVHVRPLAPRERFEIIAEWDQRDNKGRPVSQGAYSARGLLLVEGAPLATERKTLTIVPR